MASGKKNYFRHSFFAHEDEKIQHVIDKMGFEGYGYFFTLLELCGRQCADEVINPITFHIQTLRNVWRKHTKSCVKVLEKLQESGLFVVTFKGSLVELDIPNFTKYLGRYSNKSEPNTLNKRKEKKRKENKSKVNESNSDYDFNAIYKSYPKKSGKKRGIQQCEKNIITLEQYSELQKAVNNYAEQCRYESTQNKYIKQFSSFMSCWEDYIDIEKPIDPLDAFFESTDLSGPEL